jgi:signal transduction histidine kinase
MDFAAVAHDLRAPLNAMLGQMQLLAIERLSDTGRRRLQVIEAQIHRLVTLIETCGSTAEESRRLAPVNLRATIDSVVDELEALCEHRQIEVIVDGSDALPLVAGDAGELHRLLTNLLTNAADAMPDGGRIVVRARRADLPAGPVPAVEIEVSDTGTGIPPEVMPRIFERGFTTKLPGPGTGLGLPICREIVVAHGGAIDVRTVMGRGTTVQVCLPVTERLVQQIEGVKSAAGYPR